MPIHVAAIDRQEAVITMLIDEFHQNPSAKDSVTNKLFINSTILQ